MFCQRSVPPVGRALVHAIAQGDSTRPDYPTGAADFLLRCSGATGGPPMSRRRNGKCAVVVVSTRDWSPSSHHGMPTSFVGAEFYARRVSLSKANELVDRFNRDAFKQFVGRWALAVSARPLPNESNRPQTRKVG